MKERRDIIQSEHTELTIGVVAVYLTATGLVLRIQPGQEQTQGVVDQSKIDELRQWLEPWLAEMGADRPLLLKLFPFVGRAWRQALYTALAAPSIGYLAVGEGPAWEVIHVGAGCPPNVALGSTTHTNFTVYTLRREARGDC